jgi:isochorismate pyruvate lyase
MKKFDSLEDIRKQIDKIDLRILDLISERKDLVTEVVKLKRRDQIVDKKRIELILKKLNNEAKKRSLSSEFIEEIWNLMIKNFINYEEKIFDEVHKKNIK